MSPTVIQELAAQIKRKNHAEAVQQELNLIHLRQRDAALAQYFRDLSEELKMSVEIFREELGSDGADLRYCCKQGKIDIGKTKNPTVWFMLAKFPLFSGFRAEYSSRSATNRHGDPQRLDLILRDVDEQWLLECEGRVQSVSEICQSIMQRLFTV